MSVEQSRPVCVVVGVGPGNGAAFARRFAAEGYAVALLARRTELSEALAAELPLARAYACDVADAAAVASVFGRIEAEMGPPQTVLYNAGSGVWGDVEAVSPEGFEHSWRTNAMGLFLVARAVIPGMRAAGSGNIVVSGATASRRGNVGTAAFAPAKAAQRSLTEAMARHLWPAGIHVCLIIIDGVIDAEATRARMPDKEATFFLKPDAIAAIAWDLSRQDRSAWSFEVEARPFAERW